MTSRCSERVIGVGRPIDLAQVGRVEQLGTTDLQALHGPAHAGQPGDGPGDGAAQDDRGQHRQTQDGNAHQKRYPQALETPVDLLQRGIDAEGPGFRPEAEDAAVEEDHAPIVPVDKLAVHARVGPHVTKVEVGGQGKKCQIRIVQALQRRQGSVLAAARRRVLQGGVGDHRSIAGKNEARQLRLVGDVGNELR